MDIPSVNCLETDVLRARFKIETPSTLMIDLGMKSKSELNHYCIAYGKLAEIIDRYVTDGTEIVIEGILVHNESSGNSHV